jgi:hypothetical protein
VREIIQKLRSIRSLGETGGPGRGRPRPSSSQWRGQGKKREQPIHPYAEHTYHSTLIQAPSRARGSERSERKPRMRPVDGTGRVIERDGAGRRRRRRLDPATWPLSLTSSITARTPWHCRESRDPQFPTVQTCPTRDTRCVDDYNGFQLGPPSFFLLSPPSSIRAASSLSSRFRWSRFENTACFSRTYQGPQVGLRCAQFLDSGR